MSARSRFRWTLLAATIAHAAWLAWAGRGGAAQVAGRAEVRDSAHVEETEVDVEPAPAAAARPVSPPKEESAGPVAVAPLDARRGATAALATAAAAAGSGSSTGSLEPAPPDSSADRGADRGGWAFSPRVDGALASGGSLSAAPDAGVGMRDVLARGDASGAPGGGALPSVTPRDVDLGLAQGGPFVAMARDRVRRSLVPTTSHGVFEFTTDALGVVVSVRCVDASSGREQWDGVATQLQADARSAQPVRVPQGAHGLVIVVDVTSSLKTVTGGNPNPSTAEKIVGAITNPVDTIIDSRVPPQHVVAGHVSDVHAY